MVRIISTRSEKLWGQNVGLSAASQLLRSGGGVTGAPDVHPLLPGSKINSGVRGEPFVAPAGSDCSDAPNLLAPPGTRGTSLSQATERLPWTSPSLSKPPAALAVSSGSAGHSEHNPASGGRQEAASGCASPCAPGKGERRGGAARESAVPPAAPGPLPHFACLPGTALAFRVLMQSP